MILHDFALAPNPRRVRMFLAEKRIMVPRMQVDIREGAQFAEDFRRRNPWSTVPVLELDDGCCIAESVAICRYFEERHPEPSLFGRDAREKARIEMWNRRAELDGYVPLADAVRNRLARFADRAVTGLPSGFPQIPAVAARGLERYRLFLERLDRRLAERRFLAGERFSIADITAFVTVEFANRIDERIPEGHRHLARWHGEVAARPSAAA